MGPRVDSVPSDQALPTRVDVVIALVFGHHEDRIPTHGHSPTREEAVAAFAKSWRRE
jgi:hypothetical protein